MRLGEMLLQEKLVPPEGLEEALESQVVHGGRLGTNLVELGLLGEKDLARMLGKQHGVAFASGEMNADPRAFELVDPNYADDKDILPMRVDPTRITLAMINPHDIAVLDKLAFKTGKRVIPVVIPEFRMVQLLRRYCKAFRPMRAIDMNTVRPSRTLQGPEKAAAPEKSPDLMSEEEFQSMYAQALRGGSATATPAQAARPAEEEEEVLEATEVVQDEAPQPAAPALVSEPPPEEVVEEPVTPLSFSEAQWLLQASIDREDVARTVLRFALGKWKRCLLLSVQANLVTGWHGVGEGIREDAVLRIGIALRGQSTFKLVRDTRSHYIGPVKADPGSTSFYKLLGGGFPQTAVMLPLLVRGKVVHVLYVDNGPAQLTPPDIGELLILSQSVARSYEAMIKRRKSAA
jgi:hypothetical protein